MFFNKLKISNGHLGTLVKLVGKAKAEKIKFEDKFKLISRLFTLFIETLSLKTKCFVNNKEFDNDKWELISIIPDLRIFIFNSNTFILLKYFFLSFFLKYMFIFCLH